MTDEFFSGNWEGSYTYGHNYSEARRRIKVGFYMKLKVDEGKLEGTCEEYITKVFMGRPATVKGFIKDNYISFVKQYPFFYEIDEERQITVDETKPPHLVYYSGIFDPTTKTFSGDWEIRVSPEESSSDADEDSFLGTWEIRKA